MEKLFVNNVLYHLPSQKLFDEWMSWINFKGLLLVEVVISL